MKKVTLTFAIIIALLVTTNTFSQSKKIWEKKAGSVGWLTAAGNGTRGLAYNPATNHIIVCSRDNGNQIVVLDAATGDSVGALSTSGMADGTYLFNIPRVTSDGVIYICNLALAGAGTKFKVYRYANETAVPTVALLDTNMTQRTGDAFQITGSGNNTLLYASGSSSTRIFIYGTTNGTTFSRADSIVVPVGAARGGISFITSGRTSDLWINGAGTNTYHINSTGTIIDTINGGVVPTGWLNVVYFAPNTGRKYVSVVGRNDAVYGGTLQMWDITNSEKWPTLWATTSVTPYNTNSNATGDAAIVDGGNGYFDIYTLISNNVVSKWRTNMLTIAQARVQTNFVPTRLNDTVTVQGIVTSPSFRNTGTGHSMYLWDGTAGTNIFSTTVNIPNLHPGLKLKITGKVAQYNGLTEIATLDTTSYTVISDSNALPAPVILTFASYKANPELYEGTVIGFSNVTKVSGTWPTTNTANVTLKVKQGADTLDFFINRYGTDFYQNPEPTWPKDIIGIGGQFTTTTPPNAGYQLLARTMVDILPNGTLPVELTSFTAKVVKNAVALGWTTATENNNRGFEIERSVNGKSFVTIGFVQGHGSTSSISNYSFVDKDVKAGQSYSYRLKQVDFDGTFAYSSVVSVDGINTVQAYSLSQNYPNPFNPTTNINFTLPVNAKVSVKVFNVLGKEVMTVVNNQLEAGSYNYSINMTGFSSGVYFYQLEASGSNGSNFKSIKKLSLIK